MGPAKKVLVVDDDEDIRALFRCVLELDGFEVACAADGEEALAIGTADRPDFIVLDLMMPRMSGAEFLAEIRDRPALANVPVVVCSGKVTQPDGIDTGARFVAKPVDPAALSALIGATLGGGRVPVGWQ